jgi:hypothetical protein
MTNPHSSGHSDSPTGLPRLPINYIYWFRGRRSRARNRAVIAKLWLKGFMKGGAFVVSEFKAGKAIAELKSVDLFRLFSHPGQRDTFRHVEALIGALRCCETPKQFFEFQKELFAHASRVGERRAECARIAKRLRSGRPLPADPPEPPPSGDVADAATWDFEVLVQERLSRQFRSVGDGLAWRLFAYDRRVILALSQNSSPGPIIKEAGRLNDPTTGLAQELGAVIEIWRDRGNFALLHDLTNCLRIADLTEFSPDGRHGLHEIKRDPKNKSSAQRRRMEHAIQAVTADGPLPGKPHARVVDLLEPYRTNLAQLSDVIDLAHSHGSRGMKLSQGRAIIASSPFDLAERYSNDHEAGIRAMQSSRQSAIRRAGIASSTHHINGRSADSAARSTIAVPWAIYPLSPADCAALICDFASFETIISVDVLTDLLRREGLVVGVLLPHAHGQLTMVQNVMKITNGRQEITIHPMSIGALIYELLEPGSWARGIAELLNRADVPAEPLVRYANDLQPWWPRLRATP